MSGNGDTRLISELRKRAAGARAVPLRHVTFRDGVPLHNQCHENVAKMIAEYPYCKAVRGWLVTSGAIFDKHTIVDEGGVLYDITPSRAPATPFMRHKGSDEEFDAARAQLIILPEERSAKRDFAPTFAILLTLVLSLTATVLLTQSQVRPRS